MKISYTELTIQECDWLSAEEKEIILFGIKQSKSSLCSVLVTLVIGMFMGVIWESILFIICFLPLRRYAGGFHAQTQGRCIVFSVTALILTFFMIKYLRYIAWLTIVLSAMCLIIFWKMAPIENEKRMLCKKEKAHFGKKARLIAGVEFITLLIAVFLEKKQYAKTVMTGFIMVVLCMVSGYVQLKIRQQTN